MHISEHVEQKRNMVHCGNVDVGNVGLATIRSWVVALKMRFCHV